MAAIGTGKCLNAKCGQQVAVIPTKGGGRNWSCRHCGLSVYCRGDSDAKNDLDALMVKRAPAAAPAGEKKPEPSAPASKAGYRMPGT
jgi:hypothetical protein